MIIQRILCKRFNSDEKYLYERKFINTCGIKKFSSSSNGKYGISIIETNQLRFF
jgi:hypothetical protein